MKHYVANDFKDIFARLKELREERSMVAEKIEQRVKQAFTCDLCLHDGQCNNACAAYC